MYFEHLFFTLFQCLLKWIQKVVVLLLTLPLSKENMRAAITMYQRGCLTRDWVMPESKYNKET
jgi:hypothetical protein